MYMCCMCAVSTKVVRGEKRPLTQKRPLKHKTIHTIKTSTNTIFFKCTYLCQYSTKMNSDQTDLDSSEYVTSDDDNWHPIESMSEDSSSDSDSSDFEFFSSCHETGKYNRSIKGPTKKQLKSLEQLIPARTIIYGHYSDEKKRILCDCLSNLTIGKDDLWLQNMIGRMRLYICRNVTTDFGDDEHVQYMKEMIMGKFLWMCTLHCL